MRAGTDTRRLTISLAISQTSERKGEKSASNNCPSCERDVPIWAKSYFIEDPVLKKTPRYVDLNSSFSSGKYNFISLWVNIQSPLDLCTLCQMQELCWQGRGRLPEIMVLISSLIWVPLVLITLYVKCNFTILPVTQQVLYDFKLPRQLIAIYFFSSNQHSAHGNGWSKVILTEIQPTW